MDMSALSKTAAQEDEKDVPVSDDLNSQQSFTALALTLITIPTVLTSFLVFLDSAILVTAIPTIVDNFGTIADIGWYSSVYMLCNCSVQPLLGQFYARLPLKLTFIAFLVIFEIGSLVCGLATSSGMFIAGRALAGFGGAGVLNGSLAIISASISLKRRPAFLGAALGVGQLGTAFGPSIGGALTQYLTWRWNFYLNLPCGGFALALLLVARLPKFTDSHVHDTRSKTRSILTLDWSGFLLFASSVVMLLIALQWGSSGTRSWKSSTVIGLFIGAAVDAICFLLWERRKADRALIPSTIMCRPVVYSSCLTCFFQMANMVITLYYLPLWFQIIKKKSAALSGVYLLPMVGLQIVVMVVTGALAGRIGYIAIFCIINGAIVAAGSGMATMLTASTSRGFWLGAELLIGFGRGFGLQMPFIAIQASLPPAEAAVGTSLAIFSQYFGGALFSGISEATLVSSLTSALAELAPGVDPRAVTAAGAAELGSVVSEDKLQVVLEAYDRAIGHVFWLMTATALIMMVSCLGMGLKGKEPLDQNTTEEAEKHTA